MFLKFRINILKDISYFYARFAMNSILRQKKKQTWQDVFDAEEILTQLI